MSRSRSRFSKFLASVVLAPLAALTLGSAPASADTISMHGTICNQYGTMVSTDLLYTESGVWNNMTTPRLIICSIPRVPIATGGQTFVVEGTNAPNQTTTCSIRSFSFNGTSIATKSFTSTGLPYTRTLTFTAAEMPNSAYVSMICELPANRGGYLRGVRALNLDNSGPTLQPLN
jgi:hypothetical protein